ncbi:MAG: LeuA family protein [Gemmatimonadota bacterium]|jgi:2-isopropylmalate synthase|nr:LeuA family protein [Gemmatimonadota bacterium]MDP6529207.1 LeuA family protein [Gemmatimonadota bacterium]MDP6803458.1 LeuA family protein [Gemmatimonadota bacterium]MDP7031463.1 LeuA family protein [Gemmatimonadota bacterium]
MPRDEKLIFDWNRPPGFSFRHKDDLHLNDETLRDGLQSPSVRDPSIEEKLQILHLMGDLGIDAANLGLPGAGERAARHIERLVQEIADCSLSISPNVAVRTVVSEIEPLIDISSRTGIPVEACTFIGSSGIRRYTEGWDLDGILKKTEESIRFGVDHDIPMCYVTEDTTRADPTTLERLYRCAIESGATRIVVADTVGHATPIGVRELLRHIFGIVKDSGEDVLVDWHGHSDRGIAIPNCMMAIASGVDRVHGTALGIGERCGNVPMDLLLVNLRLEGITNRDLSRLDLYVRTVCEATGVPIPFSYPVFGEDAFRTSTGVHAAAILKAKRKGKDWLADQVYSGVPADMVGLSQRVEIGFMSGKSNVIFYLEARGIKPEAQLVKGLLAHAKDSSTVLTDEQVDTFIAEHEQAGRDS